MLSQLSSKPARIRSKERTLCTIWARLTAALAEMMRQSKHLKRLFLLKIWAVVVTCWRPVTDSSPTNHHHARISLR